MGQEGGCCHHSGAAWPWSHGAEQAPRGCSGNNDARTYVSGTLARALAATASTLIFTEYLQAHRVTTMRANETGASFHGTGRLRVACVRHARLQPPFRQPTNARTHVARREGTREAGCGATHPLVPSVLPPPACLYRHWHSVRRWTMAQTANAAKPGA